MGNFDSDLVIDDKHIKYIAVILHKSRLIHEDWLNFAKGLGIPDLRIKKFKKDLYLHKITFHDIFSNIVGLWIDTNGSKATLNWLLRVIEEDCGDSTESGELLRLEFDFPCRRAQSDLSSISWNGLSPAFQNKVIHNLKAISPTLSIPDILLPELNGNLLVSLMTGKNVTLLKETLPTNLTYYVNRIVIRRNIISLTIFNHARLDILLLTGTDRYELSGMTKNGVVRSSSEQLKNVTAKFIILDHPHHFDKICTMTACPVHWLQYEKGELLWIRSKGDMRTVQEHIGTSQIEEHEEEFLTNLKSNQPVCISDTPGMGKTVLLARIGNQLRKRSPENTVIFLALTEVIQQVQQITSKVNINAIEEALRNLVSDNELGMVILRSKLRSCLEGNSLIELLLDGLDEVPGQHLKLAYEILQIITTSFQSIRLWVSTRPHLLEELENTLNVLGYNIKPFDRDDQLRFLTMYWSPDPHHDYFKLQQFGKHCLDSLNSNIKMREHEIAGVPLQCLLIGEVYEEEATAYATAAESTVVPKVLINSITDLYKLLIAKKFQKYLSVHKKTDFGGTQALMEMHARLSLQLIFPTELMQLEQLLQPVQIDDILKIGILEAKSSSTAPTFIHRTFAEYFVAHFMIDRIGTNDLSSELCHFLISSVLDSNPAEYSLYFGRFKSPSFEFVHSVITYFLNALLADVQVIPLQSQELLRKSLNRVDRTKQIAHSCATSDFFNLLQFQQSLGVFGLHISKIFDEDLVNLAIIKSSLPLLKLAFSNFEDCHAFTRDFENRVLRNSVIKGDFSIFEFLIKGKQLAQIIQNLNPRTRCLLHECTKFSLNYSEEEISAKIQIMRMLVGINPKLLEAQDEEGETPIVSHQAHVRIMIELVRLGADLLVQTQFEETFLHTALFYMSSEQFNSVITSIPLESLKKLVGRAGIWGGTPLIRLVESVDPQPETLERFREAGANFNCPDEDQNSLLNLAIEREWGMSSLRKLIECGSNVTWKDKDKGQSLLHVAAEYGNLAALLFLLEEHGMDVNPKDDEGLTPLDYAIRNDRIRYTERNKFVGCFETGQALHSRGGRFKDIIDGSPWLHIISTEGKFQSIKLLLSIGVDINSKDEQGNTALHAGVKDKYLQTFTVTKLLLENGADPNILNKAGESPLHTSLTNTRLDMDTFEQLKSKTNMTWTPIYASRALYILINQWKGLDEQEFCSFFNEFENAGADINYTNESRNSLLHAAVGRERDHPVRHLVSRGACVNPINSSQRTPLIIGARAGNRYFSLDIIKYLIDHGADVYAKDEENNNFLHYFVLSTLGKPMSTYSSFFHSIVEYLIGKGYSNLFDIPGGDVHATPTQLAVYNLEPERRTLDMLHSSNVNFNAVDNKGDSLLAYAVRGKRNTGFLASLINTFGADWKIRNSNGESLLHLAARDGTLEAMKFLIDLEDLHVNERSKVGNTPLHLAAQLKSWNQDLNFLKCAALLDNGADPNILNNKGESPLAAVRGEWDGKYEVVQLLEKSMQSRKEIV